MLFVLSHQLPNALSVIVSYFGIRSEEDQFGGGRLMCREPPFRRFQARGVV